MTPTAVATACALAVISTSTGPQQPREQQIARELSAIVDPVLVSDRDWPPRVFVATAVWLDDAKCPLQIKPRRAVSGKLPSGKLRVDSCNVQSTGFRRRGQRRSAGPVLQLGDQLVCQLNVIRYPVTSRETSCDLGMRIRAVYPEVPIETVEGWIRHTLQLYKPTANPVERSSRWAAMVRSSDPILVESARLAVASIPFDLAPDVVVRELTRIAESGGAGTWQADAHLTYARKVRGLLEGIIEANAAEFQRCILESKRRYELGVQKHQRGFTQKLRREYEMLLQWGIDGAGRVVKPELRGLWARGNRAQWNGRPPEFEKLNTCIANVLTKIEFPRSWWKLAFVDIEPFDLKMGSQAAYKSKSQLRNEALATRLYGRSSPRPRSRRGAIKRLIRDHGAVALKQCGSLQSGHSGAPVSRPLQVRWTVDPEGRVGAVVATDPAYHGTKIAACVEKRIRKWRFPAAEYGETGKHSMAHRFDFH